MLTKDQLEVPRRDIALGFGFVPSTELIENVYKTIQENKAILIENNSVRGKVWEVELLPGTRARVKYNRNEELITKISPVPSTTPHPTGTPKKRRKNDE